MLNYREQLILSPWAFPFGGQEKVEDVHWDVEQNGRVTTAGHIIHSEPDGLFRAIRGGAAAVTHL